MLFHSGFNFQLSACKTKKNVQEEESEIAWDMEWREDRQLTGVHVSKLQIGKRRKNERQRE